MFKFFINRYRKIILSICICWSSLLVGYFFGKPNTKITPEIKHDTVYFEKSDKSGIIGGIEEFEPVKPIPIITKYKVSDIVCAWGKWSGVIIKIEWSRFQIR